MLQEPGARASENNVVDVQEEIYDVGAAVKHEQRRVRPCCLEAQHDGEVGESCELRVWCLAQPV